MGYKDDNYSSIVCNHHPETCTCRDWDINEKLKLIHKQIIDAVGGEDRFREIAGLKSKQETLEEAAENYANQKGDIPTTELEDAIFKQGFLDGVKWQAEQMEKLKDFDTWKEWKNK